MNKPYFIAEVSSNHHRDLGRCRAFIERAAEVGFDAVKFQLFKVDQLFAPEILARSPQHRQRVQWELPESLIAKLAQHCQTHNIDFCCTPFYLEAVPLLAPHVAFFKIASYELLWHPLLRACAESGKKVVLSTGMATLPEIQDAVQVLSQAGCSQPTLLHCSSAYPTPPEQANLAAIETLRRHCGKQVGWSDHTRSPAVLFRAIHRWAASMIEVHLDLEGEGAEYSAGHCWLPQEIAAVIAAVRVGFDADGSGEKQPGLAESGDRDWRADPSDGLRPLLKLRATFPDRR